MTRTGLIIAGGELELAFLQQVLAELDSRGGACIAAADAGLRACDLCGRAPDLLLGDFDTVEKPLLERYLARPGIRVERHDPVKDASDLELAVDSLLKSGIRDAVVLGALGGRADHTYANFRLTYYAARRGMKLVLLDPQNRITCYLAGDAGTAGEDAEAGGTGNPGDIRETGDAVNNGDAVPREVRIRRGDQWGKYVGFFPIGGEIRHLTLSGFRYPLHDFTLNDRTSPSLTVSNEITEESGTVRFAGDPGAGLLVIESRDREKRA